ncbi:MAG: response regulator [Firmicutes bacterium HGW-Firmicutes-14]|nr:MAG: response regulator [Firmicutes bacterium HGW-Firmicutes-14]
MGHQSLDVLAVDDQAGVRYLLDAIIREEGHNSFLASNGMEAVEQVKNIRPHLVFMDIRMPVMDGTKAVEKIHELGHNPDVVIMTAFTEKDVIDRARKNGAVKCIIKPFDVEEIRSILREAEQKRFPRASAL